MAQPPRGGVPGAPPRVVTLTPAPALDRVYASTGIVPGVVNRVRHQDSYLAGKGLNIAHAVSLASPFVRAVVPLGPVDGAPAHAGWWPDIAPGVVEVVDVHRPVRQNAVIATLDGHTTNLNEEPSALDRAEWSATVERTLTAIDELGARRLVVGGALPCLAETGVQVELGALFERAQEFDARVAVDLSGTALSRYAAHPLVDLVKPNLTELQEIAHGTLHTFGDVVDAARAVIARPGVPLTVVVSLGVDGLLGVRADTVHWAPAPVVPVVNTTGAGDAALAGVLSRLDPEGDAGTSASAEILAAAVALGATWGSIAVSHPTTRPAHLPAVPLVSTIPLDPRRVLAEATASRAVSGLTGAHA